MTTIKDMLADAKRQTYGSLSDQINLISAVSAPGADEISLELDVTGITAGMVLSAGLNVWYVKGISSSENLVYVIPGYDNSPQDATAIGDFVYIKPRVTDWYLFNVLNQEIIKLSSPSNGLYKISAFVSEVNATWQTYEIPDADAAAFTGMLRIRYRVPGSAETWIDIPEKAYRIQINEGTSYIRMLRNIPSGSEIEFTYKGSFTQATSLLDDPVADCGLTETMVDIPPLGCVATLLRTTDSRRNQVQQQGDARRAGEVGNNSNAAIANQIDRQYRDRVQEEYARLTTRVPIIRSL
jgi:hypothetical protein